MKAAQRRADRDDPDRVSVETPSVGRARRSPWPTVAVVLVPVVGLVTLLAASLGNDPRDIGSRLVGQRAPAFELRDLATGKIVRLADYRGAPVVLNFWATWCAPCYVEDRHLRRAWRTYSDDGVEFLSILYQDDPATARRADRQTFDRVWPDLHDPRSRTAIDYGVVGIPETFLVAADGTVVHKVNGPVTFEALSPWIERMVAGMERAGP